MWWAPIVRRFDALNAEEEADLIRRVAETKPDFFWVGLSTPKQEKFMDQYLPKLDTKLMFGVGAAFDMHTGRIKDAPYWMKVTGVQWMHRIYQDPSAAVEAVFGEQSEICLSDHAGVVGFQKAAGSLVNRYYESHA